VQIDPMKPTLKPRITKHLKLKCDEPLSNFALKFNLRRYIKDYGDYKIYGGEKGADL